MGLDWYALGLPVLFGMVLAAVATYLVRGAAHRTGLLDRPDGARKLHGRPVALGGGFAILIAVIGAVSFSVAMGAVVPTSSGSTAVLAFACVLITAIGLLDDARDLKGRTKLALQMVPVLACVVGGFTFRRMELFGVLFDLGSFSPLVSALWLLAAVNAINLIDGMDGVAATVGAITSAAIAVMALLTGHPFEAAVAAGLTGSLLGFLVFNFPPASVFMGDAGSMLIGLLVGCLAISASLKTPTSSALAAPLVICSLPLMDTLAAIVRRKMTGRSLYTTDRAHLHHRVFQRLRCRTRTLGLIALLCVGTALGGLVSLYLRNDALAFLSAALVATLLAVTRVFGDLEFQLLAGKGRQLVRRALGVRAPHQSVTTLQGDRNWSGDLWEPLGQLATELGVSQVDLVVDVPHEGETFHGEWHAADRGSAMESWKSELPVYSGDIRVGRLVVQGVANGIPISKQIDQFGELLMEFQSRSSAPLTLGPPVHGAQPVAADRQAEVVSP